MTYFIILAHFASRGTMAKSTKASSKAKAKKTPANLLLAKAGTAFSIPTEVTSRRDKLEDGLPVGAIGRVSIDPFSSLWNYENMRTAAVGLVAAVNGNKSYDTINRRVNSIVNLSWEIGYHKIEQQIAALSTLDASVMQMQNKLLKIIQELRVTHRMENIPLHLITELTSFGAVETAYSKYHQGNRDSKKNGRKSSWPNLPRH